MLADGFVTVVREGADVSWEALQPAIGLALMETKSTMAAEAAWRPEPQESLGEVEQHIEAVLDRYVRPLLAADGGEAILDRFDARTGTAWVRIEGACGGCPSGGATLKQSIEQAIRRWVPEVSRVEAVGEPIGVTGDAVTRFRQWTEAKWGKQ